jgi:hypothetical protein
MKKKLDRLCGQSSWLQNWYVLCFLWGTNWIHIGYVEESRPPLWSSGRSSWLQILRYGFDSLRYKIFWEAVGLERGPFSPVITIKELLERKSSGFGLENLEYGCRDQSRWPQGTPYPQKLRKTSPTNGGRSVGVVRSWTHATEFSYSKNHIYQPSKNINLLPAGIHFLFTWKSWSKWQQRWNPLFEIVARDGMGWTLQWLLYS